MYVRLAFAVAAHLEPEILVVDEVLAVGDAEFQKKCLGKMGEVAKGGRTVLFVSHNMAAVRQLCPKTMLMKNGNLYFFGSSDETIEKYLSSQISTLHSLKNQENNATLQIEDIYISDINDRKLENLIAGKEIKINIEYKISCNKLEMIVCVINFYTALGQPLFSCNTRITGKYLTLNGPIGKISCTLPALPLNCGRYYMDIAVKQGTDPKEILVELLNILQFTVEAGDYFGTGFSANQKSSPILINHSWIVSN